MSQKTKLTNIYKCDLSQTDENGAFQCPNCGQTISPDDLSEENYFVYETVITENNLTEVVIYCKSCLSFIHLIGFQKLPFLK
jgi:Zn finger protein HypA/HybF involved in hydrogenase expression